MIQLRLRWSPASAVPVAQVQLAGDSKAALVERERALLTDALELLDEVCPQVGCNVPSGMYHSEHQVVCAHKQG
jgi:nitrite reductase/ring-hydroxylating ferredoxin subunit